MADTKPHAQALELFETTHKTKKKTAEQGCVFDKGEPGPLCSPEGRRNGGRSFVPLIERAASLAQKLLSQPCCESCLWIGPLQ